MKRVSTLVACTLLLPLLACDPAPADGKGEAAKAEAAKAEGKGEATKEATKAEAPAPEAKTDAPAPAPEAKAEAPAPTPAPEAAPSGPDPCALVTRERAGEALHSPVEEGVRSGNTCKWKATAGPGSVTIQITEGRGAEVYARELALLHSDETLADLGTAAFRSGNVVGVHVGDRYVSIGVAPNIGQGPMAKPADAVALARDAIRGLAP